MDATTGLPFSPTQFRRLSNALRARPEDAEAPRDAARFSRFELRHELGRGGAGIVWRAFDPILRRDVALKILPPHRSPDSEERFRREARAVSRLRHPSLAAVHECGIHEGRPYLVMDVVEGRPLSDFAPMEPRRAARVVARAARAVQAAHAAGVLHRDLKPSNILLAEGDRPVIVDFGLARTVGEDTRITATGAVLGTPAYLAPEVASGRSSVGGVTADVYALGAVLHELLAGSPPHGGRTIFEVLRSVQHRRPAPPPGPAGLVTIVRTAMSRRLDERYPSMAVMADDLEGFLRGGPIWAKRNRIPRWLPAILTAVVAAVAFLPGRPAPKPAIAGEPEDDQRPLLICRAVTDSPGFPCLDASLRPDWSCARDNPVLRETPRSGPVGKFANGIEEALAGKGTLRVRPLPKAGPAVKFLYALMLINSGHLPEARRELEEIEGHFPSPGFCALLAAVQAGAGDRSAVPAQGPPESALR